MMNSCSVLISLSCIVYNSYSPRTEFVGLKKFILNLKFCGLRVHDLSLSCWEIWYDGLELLQICSERKFYVRNFYLWKLQNKKFLDDEKYLPEPYAWSLQRNHLVLCCLCRFELCQILWPLWVSFHTFIIENHVHTTPTCLNFHTGRIAFPYHPFIFTLFYVPCSINVSPKILSNKGMSHVLKKKGAHEGPWKKINTWRSMQK